MHLFFTAPQIKAKVAEEEEEEEEKRLVIELMEAVMAARVVVVLVAATFFGGVLPAEAAVHKVGDATGWTILGSPNYTAWAVSQAFNVGDIVVFVYNKKFHNVLEVSKADYKACNAAAPIATYASGNDSIHLSRRGHHFFICGFPGHCSAGQKVDIRIAKLSTAALGSSPASTPAAVDSGTVPSPAPAPSPRASGGAARARAPRGLAGFAAYLAVLCFGRLILLQ